MNSFDSPRNENHPLRLLKRLALRLFFAGLWLCMVGWFLWATGAIWFHTWLPSFTGPILAIAFFVAGLLVFRRLRRKRWWMTYVAVAVICVYAMTLFQQPSSNRKWAVDQAKAADIQINNGHVQIGNFRHTTFRSESDFKVAHREFDFELKDLDAVWFLVQKFTALEGLAHTFVTFRATTIDGPKYFCVSVEIRREQNEQYSPIKGLYRRYELFYAIGDERDIIGQRTNMRPADRVYMYKVNATPEQVQKLFVEIAERNQRLRDSPEFYHTLLNNCTNNIVSHTYKLTPEPLNPIDLRIALPGFSARLAYAIGLIGDGKQRFKELQTISRIDQIAKQAGITDSFSRDIRQQVP